MEAESNCTSPLSTGELSVENCLPNKLLKAETKDFLLEDFLGLTVSPSWQSDISKLHEERAGEEVAILVWRGLARALVVVCKSRASHMTQPIDLRFAPFFV